MRAPCNAIVQHNRRLCRAGLISLARGTVEGLGELQAYYTDLTPADRKRLLAIARALLKESGK